ncbi:MAG: nucleotide pyrophosphohydrolase [Planctomycetota bacterium]|nr:MAG: nucleotide pyrophosphohydrolase [Planctomycetota bacterium]
MSNHSKAFDLRQFQQHMAETYGDKDRERGVAGTFMYLMEEIGELSEALRQPGQHDLEGEFADCLAWLTSLAHVADIDLAAATAQKYTGICNRCGQSPCICKSKP